MRGDVIVRAHRLRLLCQHPPVRSDQKRGERRATTLSNGGGQFDHPSHEPQVHLTQVARRLRVLSPSGHDQACSGRIASAGRASTIFIVSRLTVTMRASRSRM